MLIAGILKINRIKIGEESSIYEYPASQELLYVLMKSVYQKKIVFLNQNICCGYSKEPSQ